MIVAVVFVVFAGLPAELLDQRVRVRGQALQSCRGDEPLILFFVIAFMFMGLMDFLFSLARA